MKWKLSDLLKIKAELLLLSNDENLSSSDKFKYANDLALIDRMINYIQENKYNEDFDINLTNITDKNYYKKVIDWINENSNMAILSLRKFEDLRVKTDFLYRRNHLFEDSSIELVKSFFTEFNPTLINFLDCMIYKNQIQFGEKNRKSFNNNNSILNLMTTGDSYLWQYDSLRLSDSQYLTKNIQMAYDFNQKDDSLKQNTNLSPFALAKGKFAQMAYIDYLFNNGYQDEALVLEGKNLNDFFKTIDLGLGAFAVPSKALIINDRLKNGKYNPYIKSIISTLQAYSWLEDYRNNPEETKLKIQEFDKAFGKNELDMVNGKDIKNMSDNVVSLTSNYTRKRTLYR